MTMADITKELETLRRRVAELEDLQTEREQAKEAVRLSEQNFLKSMENSTMGIRIVDKYSNTLYTNQAFLDTFGYENYDEVRSSPPYRRYTPESYTGYVLRKETNWQDESVINQLKVDIVRKDGVIRHLQLSRKEVSWDGKEAYQCFYNDITDRMKAQKQNKLSLDVLQLLNESGEKKKLISDLLKLFKNDGQYDAIGIRLLDGNDYPYYATSGFPGEHTKTENRLCAVDDKGEIICDSRNHPILECMCGNVICGRFDPSKPFFTDRGSFWTNSTTHLLASTTEEERQARTRNRCNGEGYESVALIPLKANNVTIG